MAAGDGAETNRAFVWSCCISVTTEVEAEVNWVGAEVKEEEEAETVGEEAAVEAETEEEEEAEPVDKEQEAVGGGAGTVGDSVFSS